jgi:hypothetical protein
MHLTQKSLASLLLLFLTACQTGKPTQFQSQYIGYEQSARTSLTQKLALQQPQLTMINIDDLLQISETENGTDSQSVNSIQVAQQLALQHSKHIAAIFIDLGIHEAETVQHQLLENPGLELSLMRPEAGGRWQLEFSVSLGLLDWLSRQQRTTLAESERIRWQAQAWQLLSDELTDVRDLWLEAVATQQKRDIHSELYESASVASDFAALVFDAGNISELELLSNQSIADQRRAQLIEANFNVSKALNNLKQSLGIRDLATITVPDQLPEIIQTNTESNKFQSEHLKQMAQQHQPALQLVKFEAQQNQNALALAVRQTRLRDAGMTIVTERESDGEQKHGFALGISAPIFDNGETELSVLQGHIQRTQVKQAQLELQTAADIDTSLQEINSSLEQLNGLASDELPRFQRMMALSLQEYNFMLRDTFELLTVADLMMDARLRQVDVSKQYWRAVSTLENLLGVNIQETQND